MLLNPPLRAGDVIRLKKHHACGNDLWEVLFAGADVRLKCTSCGRVIFIDRAKFSSRFKKRIEVAKTGK
ncbi:MAG TPA: DUF951 domain-containing protein [Firmicutes bacterium]|nr:DUF951 domain-containing protein [Candidatus Fermentithermobacillaceae bacterium]